MIKKREDSVVLVNKSGRKTGVAEKMNAHEKGLLHRAFSIFIFNEKGEMLLQKRAASKYHFAGLWTNACCSHPKPGEKVLAAAKRRMSEELGFTVPLKIVGNIIYCFHDKKSALTEHEYDYILAGKYNTKVIFNRNEVSAVKWITLKELFTDLKSYPQKYTPWF